MEWAARTVILVTLGFIAACGMAACSERRAAWTESLAESVESRGADVQRYAIDQLPRPALIKLSQFGRNLEMRLFNSKGEQLGRFDAPGTTLGVEILFLSDKYVDATLLEVGAVRAVSATGQYDLEVTSIAGPAARAAALVTTANSLFSVHQNDFGASIDLYLAATEVASPWREFARYWAAYATSEYGDRQDAIDLLDFRTDDPVLQLVRDFARARAAVYVGNLDGSIQLLDSVEPRLRGLGQSRQFELMAELATVYDFYCVVENYRFRQDHGRTPTSQHRPACERHLTYASKSQDPSMLGFAYSNAGSAALNDGNYDYALQVLDKSTRAFQRAQRFSFAANSMAKIARIHRETGDITAARNAVRGANRLLARKSRLTHQGMVHLRGAELHEQVADYERAQVFARGALATFAEAGNLELANRARRILARSLFTRGEYEAASEQLSLVQAFYRDADGVYAEKVAAAIEQVRAKVALGKVDQAEAELALLLQDVQGVVSPFARGRNLLDIATLHMHVGNFSRAQELAGSGGAAFLKAGSSAGQAEAAGLVARASLAAGRYDDARAQARTAIDLASRLRARLEAERLGPAYAAKVHDFFGYAVEAILNDPDYPAASKVRDAFAYVLESRTADAPAQAFSDSAELRELRRDVHWWMSRRDRFTSAEEVAQHDLAIAAAVDAFETALAAGREHSPAERLNRQILPELAPDEALLAYLWSDRAGWRFKMEQGHLSVATLPAHSALQDDVARAHRLLKNARSRQRGPLIRLGKILVPGFNEQITRLYVLPDGPVQALSLGVLGAPHQAAYHPLLMDMDISYVSHALQAVGTPHVPPLDGGITVFAGAEFATPAGSETDPFATWLDRLPPLAGSRAEAQTIADVFQGEAPVNLFLGADATKANLMSSAVPPQSILHIATHGFFTEGFADVAGLAFTRVAGDPGEQLFTAQDVPFMENAHELVVLNGCETSMGRNLRGQGVQGMPRAFLRTGSRSVVGTLWRVSDRGAQTLMDAFYRHIQASNGSGVAAALAAAQRRVFVGAEGSGSRAYNPYAHPHHWGAYVHYL